MMLPGAAAAMTLKEWFQHEPDPYPTPRTIFETYSVAGIGGAAATSSTALKSWCESSTHPLIFMSATSEHKPLIGLMHFTGGLAGAATQGKWMLLGDVTDGGQLPDMVKMPNEYFRSIIVNVNCVAAAEMQAAWTNLPAGELLLPSNAAAAADGSIVPILTRKSVPVPHEYATALIQMQDSGHLTWRRLWTQLIAPVILTDPQKTADYQEFIEFAQVASTQAHANGGDADPRPELEINYAPVPRMIKDQALQRLKNFLPGMGPPAGLAAQMQQMQHQFVAAQAATAAAAAPKTPTIQSTNPHLYEMIARASRTANEADFGPYWTMHIGRKPGEYLGMMGQALFTVSRNLGITTPIMAPAFATDMGTGSWISTGVFKVTKGASPFRFVTHQSEAAVAAEQRNYAFTLMGHGAGVVQMNAQNLALANNEVDLPKNMSQFRSVLEGYMALLIAFYSETCPMVVTYQAKVYLRIHHFERWIGGTYIEEKDQRGIFVLILVYIWRVTNQWLCRALEKPLTDPDPVPTPPYAEIEAKLELGQIESLTLVPPGLYRRHTPSAPPAGPTGGGNNDGGGGGGGNTDSRRVTNLNQNVNLKNAWAALGHTSPYDDASPFQRGQIIPTDGSDRCRICIPFALTGTCYNNCHGKHEALTPTEVQRLAQAGGFTVN